MNTSKKIMRQQRIIEEILKERRNQDEKWGEQNHKPIEWIAILMEEVGEASKEIVNEYFIGVNSKDSYRKEMIQVAAVALHMIECIDKDLNIPKKKATSKKIWRDPYGNIV